MCKKELEDKKKYIISNSSILTNIEHIEIFKILKKYNIKYSENSNGIFINLNYLDNKIIDEIFKFIYFCIKNKEKLKIESKERDNLKKILNKNQHKQIDNKQSYKEKNKNENFKFELINDYDINIDNNETYYKENTFIIPQLK